MGIAKWIMTLKDSFIKAFINAIVGFSLVAFGGVISFIFISARIGLTTGEEQKELNKKVELIQENQDVTQANQQKSIDIFILAIDSLNESIEDLRKDVQVLADKVVDLKVQAHERDLDMKENKKDIKELIRLSK